MQFQAAASATVGSSGYYTDVFPLLTPTGSNPWTYTMTNAPRPYSMIQVVILGNGGVPYCCNITDGTWTSTVAAFEPFPGSSGGSAGTSQCFIPCYTNASDTIKIIIYASGGSAPIISQIAGLSHGPFVPMRTDGRAYPIGAFSGNGLLSSSSGPVTIIGALSGGLRPLLKQINIGLPNPSTQVDITGTIAGAPVPIISGGGGSISIIEWESGLLCDIGSTVAIVSGAATLCRGNVIYDVVI